MEHPCKSNTSICNNAVTKRICRRMRQFYDEILATSGVRATQYALLTQVRRFDSASMTDLVTMTGYDRSALSHALRPMHRDDLVKVVSSDDARRTSHVRLTEAGARKLTECTRLWTAAEARFDAQYGADRAALLRTEFDALLSPQGTASRRGGIPGSPACFRSAAGPSRESVGFRWFGRR
jgi:DNA-binding MarR family transcriptional regulator